MMEHLVIHDHTRHELERFAGKPGHSLLLVGLAGAGKPTIAVELIAQVLNIAPEKVAQHSYFLHIIPEKNTISIESVRKAHEFVRLKTTGTNSLRRAILLEDAHCMTTEAQNAILKLLEEPPADTVLVMTASKKDALLPTILSRTQKIAVKAPLQSQLASYFKQRGLDDQAILRAYHMSKGQPGLMTHLLATDSQHALLPYIDTAKRLFQQSTFERLAQVDALAKDKEDIPLLLWAMQRVSDAALYQACQKGAEKQVHHWHSVLRSILRAQDSLRSNPQPKLMLTHLMLQL